jgi:hypothetical protein
VHEPVPYNPVASGCWTQGTPLAWPAGAHIPYSLSQAASVQVSLADATTVVDLAFQAWNETSCPSGPVNVQAYDNGPVSADAAADDCGLIQCDPTVHDPLHVIVFDDQSWPHNDPNNTLALTTVTYGVDTGTIFDADTEVNTAQHMITVQEPPPATGDVYDLRSIMTHEAGHFLGMAHATSDVPIMFAQYQPGVFTLTQDDIDGVCSIYPPQEHKSGCALAAVPQGSGAAAVAGLVAVAVLVRRRRFLST